MLSRTSRILTTLPKATARRANPVLTTACRGFTSIEIVPDEPKGPHVLTETVPGPKSKALSGQIDSRQDARTHVLVVDYDASLGNYLKDADNNTLLDVFAQISSIAIGYNSPPLLALAKTEEFQKAAINRPALGSFPPGKWSAWLEEGLMRVHPEGLDQLITTLCGSSANETALKCAFMAYRHRERQGAPFTAEEMESCMLNKSPGTPDLTILSFTSGFHGRLFGSLSATRSKAIHKVDVPAFDWPVAPFPEIKYPLEENQEANEKEEQRCLQEYERILVESKKTRPVAAVIIEPILSEGGDKHASPSFFRSLRLIAKKHGAFFIVDEVQTGIGATGTFWAHEKWNLGPGEEADFVTFSKKMQAAGVFHKRETRPSEGYRNYNTWMGDPMRALQAREMIKVIEQYDLVNHVKKTGEKLWDEIETLFKGYSELVGGLRGKGDGTFLAWDFLTGSKDRDRFVGLMRKNGVQIGGCGEHSVRLRPMLIFGDEHAKVLVDAMKKTLSEM